MGTAPPPYEQAMEPKNILRQLSIRKEDCREGGGGGTVESAYYNMVASVVNARRPAFAIS